VNGPAEHVQQRPDEAGSMLPRLMAFSDGVFAIAMTLLVVQLTVPLIPDNLSEAEIGHRLATGLLALGPAYLSFGVSFLVTAAFWMAHHRIFGYLRRYDAGLLWLNVLLLLCVAFMPFPTAVLGRYGDQTVAAILYATSLAVAGLVSASISVYASRRGLVDPAARPRVRAGVGRGLILPAVFLASIPIALFSPSAAEYSWLAVVVVDFALNRVMRFRAGVGS
jgi:uncharacterized membrane protein